MRREHRWTHHTATYITCTPLTRPFPPSTSLVTKTRTHAQGKTAVYACGRTGTNVNKLLAWARERGARRGEFATTGAVAMVVGMPNVGKSSLINLLRGKANSRGRGAGGGGGGGGEGAKQVRDSVCCRSVVRASA